MENINYIVPIPSETYESLQFRTDSIRIGLDIMLAEDSNNELLCDIYEDVIKLGEDLGCWEKWDGSMSNRTV